MRRSEVDPIVWTRFVVCYHTRLTCSVQAAPPWGGYTLSRVFSDTYKWRGRPDSNRRPPAWQWFLVVTCLCVSSWKQATCLFSCCARYHWIAPRFNPMRVSYPVTFSPQNHQSGVYGNRGSEQRGSEPAPCIQQFVTQSSFVDRVSQYIQVIIVILWRNEDGCKRF